MGISLIAMVGTASGTSMICQLAISVLPSISLTSAGRVSLVSDWKTFLSNLLVAVSPVISAELASATSWKLRRGAEAPDRRKVSVEFSGTMISASFLSRSIIAGLVSMIGALAV